MIIGLDVGGTHTDIVLLGSQGILREIKVPTDSGDLFKTVLSGLEKITEGADPKKIKRAVLSTTLTTNAIVQKKVQEVGMIVSGGPGVDPSFFKTNEHYRTASGSIDHRGSEITPINPREIEDIAREFKESGIRNVGVVGKFSVRNPEHELQIHDILKSSFGKIFMGHQISGKLNFPRRIATTYLNATTRQIHKEFFQAVQKSLEKKGLSIPMHILKADGGTMSFESSLDYPAQTILSGPSASVMGAVAFSEDDRETLILDIGGTTTDMAVLIDRAPVLNPVGIRVGDYNTLIRSLETRSIGLGGDSVVKVQNGKIVLGPERDGPAMAFGGKVPTPTDALHVLGKMDNGDREKSVKGLLPIAKELGLDVAQAAESVFNKACLEILKKAGEMIDAINSKPVYTVRELRDGHVVKPKSIMVLGGPAPCFAQGLQSLSDYSVKAVPRWHVANAIGAALARTTCEVVLFADTQRGFVTASEESFSQVADKEFSSEKAVEIAYTLLKKKAIERGAVAEDLEMEVIEDSQFNMVQGFYTTGRNIRVKVQVIPGLIRGFTPSSW